MYTTAFYGLNGEVPGHNEVMEMRIKIAQYLTNHYEEYQQIIPKIHLKNISRNTRKLLGRRLGSKIDSSVL